MVKNILILLLIAAVAGAGYFIWRQNETITELQSEVDAARAAVAAEESKKSDLSDNLESAQARLEEVRKSTAEQIQKLQNLVSERDQLAENLKMQLEPLEAQVRSLQSRFGDTEAAKQALQERVASLNSMINSRNEQIASLQDQLDEVSSAFAEAREKVTDFTRQAMGSTGEPAEKETSPNESAVADNRPDLPLVVKEESAGFLGNTRRVQIKNNGAIDFTVEIDMRHPGDTEAKTVRVVLPADEISRLDTSGVWTFRPGDTLTIRHDDYKTLTHVVE